MSELGSEHGRGDEIQPIRLVDHALHGHPVVTAGEIDHGLRRTGDRNAIAGTDRSLPKPPATMHADAEPSSIPSRPDRYLDLPAVLRSDPEQSRRAVVTEDGSRAADQDRRHPSPPLTETGATHGIDPAKDRVQPPGRDPVADCVPAVPQRL
ncbi:MAG TPA: hypothetical protein VGO13_07860 [Solirubrobacterales bacterium]|nr:hypothetical protein [Solirubrobacterales bacterium]